MHHRLFLVRLFVAQSQHRSASSNVIWTSKAVRQKFLEYFVKDHDHTFIRSSPVVPFCDPTVPFVNAGMNQFKGVFLGQSIAPCKRAANSQKCIRVGGKHNDLTVVGTDGYHHTFFEMLGSWSFGDYFKEKACRFAWELLTGPYGLDPRRLYMTYFGGDPTLSISPDLETRDIWREIGVPPENILPFGARENFWEMGVSGPCGPCSEIHYDHNSGHRHAAHRVNQGYEDLTEIWNLVFMQYNRSSDGSLSQLPCCHVDTGLGLERLVALLQGQRSNYDTDLFQPLFTTIAKNSGAPAYSKLFGSQDVTGLDTGYRILADHARMITVALADGVFPDHNPKLRRILRRALAVSQKTFGLERGLLTELTSCVAESLAETYPEIGNRMKQVHLVINHEEELLQSLRVSSASEWKSIAAGNPTLERLHVGEFPGLAGGYRALDGASDVTAELAFRLYDTFGLDEDTVATLASTRGLKVDTQGFRSLLDDVRTRSKSSHETEAVGELTPGIVEQLIHAGVEPTDDSSKYKYERSQLSGSYVFPPVKCKVQALVHGRSLASQAVPGTECGVIVDQTNFYYEAGGQASDTGELVLPNGTRVPVIGIDNVCGYLVHRVSLEANSDCLLHVSDCVSLEVCPEHRLALMRNHTATHLLNAAIRDILTVTCQRSSRVTPKHLALDFAVYGENFTARNAVVVEESVRRNIAAGIPVRRRTVSATELHAEAVTLVPGEVYPQDGIHLIEIEAAEFISREACCGTHVFNTADIEAFCVVSLQAPGAGTRGLRAVTGPCAEQAIYAGIEMLGRVQQLQNDVDAHSLVDRTDNTQQAEALEARLQLLRQKLASTETGLLPHSVRVYSLDTLATLSKVLKDEARGVLRKSLDSEMQNLLQSCVGQQFVVHFLQSSSSADTVPLQKATRLCPQLPVLLLSQSSGVVKARCCVPEHLASDRFNAQLWMQPVLDVFKAQGSPPRGQNAHLVFNMKGKKVRGTELEELVKTAMRGASELATAALLCEVKARQEESLVS